MKIGVCGKAFLAIVALLAATTTVKADAPFYRGDYYVIDKEWRNGAFTHWAWGNEQVAKVDGEGNPVLDSEGNPVMETIWYDEVHPTMGGWDTAREPLDFSGYAITIDGVDYPVYKGHLNGRLREVTDANIENPQYLSDKDFFPLTGFQLNYQITGKGNESFQVPFADGNIYKFYGDDRGVYKQNYDPATDPDTHYVTDEELATHNGKRFKIYFNGDGISENEINEAINSDRDPIYQWERPDCHATRIHLWGEGGDLTPWALGHHCTRRASRTVQEDYDGDGVIDFEYERPVYTYTGSAWTLNAYEFEFVYFGGNPTGIIFRQDSMKDGYLVPGVVYEQYGGSRNVLKCPICGSAAHEIYERDSYGNVLSTYYSSHPSYRCDFDMFIDGALYQYSFNGTPLPIENPKFADENNYEYEDPYSFKPEEPDGFEEHSIWFIDTDNWLNIVDGNTPDQYEWVTEWEEGEGWWGQTEYYAVQSKPHFPSYTGVHAEIVNTQYNSTIYDDGNGVKLKYGVSQNGGSEQTYGYMVLSTKYVDSDHPWGVPAKNLRIDYDYDRETGVNGLRYVKLNGKWFPMVKLNFRLSPRINEFELNRYGTPRSSAYLPLVDGGVYYYAGTGVKTPILTYEDAIKDGLWIAHTTAEIPENEVKPGRIYVNFGANKLMEPSLWQIPYCVPFKRDAMSNPSAKEVGRTSVFPGWDDYEDPDYPYNDPYYSYDYYNESIYSHDKLKAPLPRWVKYDAPDYKTSELYKYEMKKLDGHDGIYYFESDDLNQYNDFVCYYYTYGLKYQMKKVDTFEEFADYIYNYFKVGSQWNEHSTSDKQTIYKIGENGYLDYDSVLAEDYYFGAQSRYFKVKPTRTMVPVVDEDGDPVLDDDSNPVMVEGFDREEITSAEYDANWMNNDQWIKEGYVYTKEVHHWYGTTQASIHPFGGCCSLANGDYSAADDYSGKNKARYFKTKVDSYETVDYHSDEYALDADAGDAYINSFYVYEDETEWQEWRAVEYQIPAHHEYYVIDEDAPMVETEYPGHYTQQEIEGVDVGSTSYDKGGVAAHIAHPASRSIYFDPTNWDKYVYDIGIDCVHQSYMTTEDFDTLEPISETTKHVYLVGNKVLHGNDDWNLRNCITLDNESGVFFYDFENMTPDSPAEFKISTVNVNDYAATAEQQNFPGYYSSQRGWATFNLGLVGPHKDTSDENYDEWHETYVLPGNPTRKVRLSTDQTYDYNTYTQYSWRIDVNNEADGTIWHGMKPGDYYFVIDFIKGEETVTLLDFDPHPHPRFSDFEVRREDILDNAITLHDGRSVPGSEHSGLAMHNYANVLKAKINIGDTGAQRIADEGYKVLYTVFVNNKLAYYTDKIDVDGKPEAIEADYLDLSTDAEFAVRARYHDQKTDRYFSSKLRNERITEFVDRLPEPSATVVDKGLRFYLTDPEVKDRDIALGAAISIRYDCDGAANEDDGEYISLPGYELLGAELDGETLDHTSLPAPLIHRDHFIVNNGKRPWMYWLGNDEDPWMPGEEGDITGWSSYVSRHNHMPILIDRMRMYDENKVPNATASVKLNVYASYPFLTRDFGFDVVTLPEEFQIPAKNNDSEQDENASESVSTQVSTMAASDDISKYKLVMINRPTLVEAALNDGVTSLVEEVAVDAGEWEYYNLQGIKMPSENLTPGVYIRRNGVVAEKFILK